MSEDPTPPHSPLPERAGEVSVTRWRRYGHDRLYVSAGDGAALGWHDLRADQPHPKSPETAERLAAAVSSWRTSSGRARPAASVTDIPDAELTGGVVHAGAADDLLADAAPDDRPATDQAGGPPAHMPAPSPSVPEDHLWEDLGDRRAGTLARQQAQAHRAAAPVATFVARVVGARTEERAWRIGAVGEEKVADQLAKIARRDARWRFLHAVPVGDRGSDIDHVVIGPPGVFTVNAKHHPGAKIWVAEDTFLVNGKRQPYVRNSRHEAVRAGRLLSGACGFQVRVRALIVPVRAETITVKAGPTGVDVVARFRLARWLRSQPETLPVSTIEEIYDQARRSTTWHG